MIGPRQPPDSGARGGVTARHTWYVTESKTPDRYDAFVLDRRDGTVRAEFIGYFETPHDAAEAAIQTAAALDEVTREEP